MSVKSFVARSTNDIISYYQSNPPSGYFDSSDIRSFTSDEVFELASTLYWNENLEPGQQWKLFVLDINKSEVSGTKRVCCAKIKFYGSMYQFEANKTEYQSGETMTINFKGAPAEPNHQIAIFPEGVRDYYSMVNWQL